MRVIHCREGWISLMRMAAQEDGCARNEKWRGRGRERRFYGTRRTRTTALPSTASEDQRDLQSAPRHRARRRKGGLGRLRAILREGRGGGSQAGGCTQPSHALPSACAGASPEGGTWRVGGEATSAVSKRSDGSSLMTSGCSSTSQSQMIAIMN